MWSSQQYIDGAAKLGQESGHTEEAIKQSELVILAGQGCPSILSLNHLAKRTGIGYEDLRGFVMRSRLEGADETPPYSKFSIAKRSGGRRYIHIPNPKLMHAQRWINHHILSNLPSHVASHAFEKGSSITKCASLHCGARWLVKVDIADFFGSVSEIQVFRVFRSLGYQPLSKETKNRIRQHLHYAKKLGAVEHAFYRGFDSVWGLKAHLKGLIDYANMVEPSFATLCLGKFDEIDWPV